MQLAQLLLIWLNLCATIISLEDVPRSHQEYRPDSGYNVLSFDGGGVRGLSSLIILKVLMERLDPVNPPKPHEYFDMIAGTSTGGLIAIMLGRLKMDIDECIDAYVEVSSRVFKREAYQPWNLWGKGVRGRVRFWDWGTAKFWKPEAWDRKIFGEFNATELEEVIKEIVVRKGLPENALLKNPDGSACKVFVCATAMYPRRTTRFRSYEAIVGDSDFLESTTIWQAARATSAAPSFFDPVLIGRFNEAFTDGGTGANNPVHELWDEARNLWKPFAYENINLILSIGTGVPSLKPFGWSLGAIGQTLVNMATETEETAKHFRQDHSVLSKTGRYIRFNVDKGLEDIGLDESDRLSEIVAATRAYMGSEDVLDRTVFVGNKMLGLEGRSSVGTLSGLSDTGAGKPLLEPSKDEL